MIWEEKFGEEAKNYFHTPVYEHYHKNGIIARQIIIISQAGSVDKQTTSQELLWRAL
jgi:hypothetical protein